MQYRICPQCGQKNSISLFQCEKCDTDISMQPYVEDFSEPRKYIKCPSCGELHEIIGHFKKINVCKKCRSHKIHDCGREQIIVEGEENLVDEEKTENKSEQEPKTFEVVLLNLFDNKRIRLGRGTHLLGASGDCEKEYFWNLQYVSGKHALVEVDDKRIFITDMGSRNHTYINHAPDPLSPHMKIEITEGDIVTLADQDFRVTICR